MNPDVKIEPTTPLSAEELEQDAKNSSVQTDETTRDDGESGRPASENERTDEPDEGAGKVEGDITMLPPD